MTIGTVAQWLLAVVLVAAAGAKLAAPRASQDALTTYGLRPARLRRALWAAGLATELGLAAGLALGSDLAAYATAVLFTGFAAVVGLALTRGRAGAPCGCLGARSRVSGLAVARALLLAASAAAVPALGALRPAETGWLALGLVLALGLIAALGVAVLALAREVGALRLAQAPSSALEIPDEGPALGSRPPLLERFALVPSARLALAVFSSEGCPVCQALEPAVAYLARDPLLALETFDEHRAADVWRALAVPGSPYAVALGLDGTVLAKGTFNTLPQLEGLLATAERREEELAGV